MSNRTLIGLGLVLTWPFLGLCADIARHNNYEVTSGMFVFVALTAMASAGYMFIRQAYDNRFCFYM